jgi:hypothetical protein
VPKYTPISGWEYIKPDQPDYEDDLPAGWVQVRPLEATDDGRRDAVYWNEETGVSKSRKPKPGRIYKARPADHLDSETLDQDLLDAGVNPEVWKQYYRWKSVTEAGKERKIKEKFWVNKDHENWGFFDERNKNEVRSHPGNDPKLEAVKRNGGVKMSAAVSMNALKNIKLRKTK